MLVLPVFRKLNRLSTGVFIQAQEQACLMPRHHSPGHCIHSKGKGLTSL